ncbi:MAG: hypothetical protein QNK33_02360 [Bacteroidales bacterium]|nr:hypothetical protein [Bacteroidales bacterium]
MNWDKIRIKELSGHYTIKNLWENKLMGSTENNLQITIPARDVLIIRLIK